MGRIQRGGPATATFTWEDEARGIFADLSLSASISDYDPGRTYGPPENCYPPEGGEIEDVTVDSVDGGSFSTDDDERPIEEKDHARVEKAFLDAYHSDSRLQEQVDEALRDGSFDQNPY